jgi:hypothetical protein
MSSSCFLSAKFLNEFPLESEASLPTRCWAGKENRSRNGRLSIRHSEYYQGVCQFDTAQRLGPDCAAVRASVLLGVVEFCCGHGGEVEPAGGVVGHSLRLLPLVGLDRVRRGFGGTRPGAPGRLGSG